MATTRAQITRVLEREDVHPDGQALDVIAYYSAVPQDVRGHMLHVLCCRRKGAMEMSRDTLRACVIPWQWPTFTTNSSSRHGDSIGQGFFAPSTSIKPGKSLVVCWATQKINEVDLQGLVSLHGPDSVWGKEGLGHEGTRIIPKEGGAQTLLGVCSCMWDPCYGASHGMPDVAVVSLHFVTCLRYMRGRPHVAWAWQLGDSPNRTRTPNRKP